MNQATNIQVYHRYDGRASLHSFDITDMTDRLDNVVAGGASANKWLHTTSMET